MAMAIIDYSLEEEDISENVFVALRRFWGRNSAVQSSVTRVDAYDVSSMMPSYASRMELPFVAVQTLMRFLLTHMTGRRVPFPQYASR